MVTKLNHTLEHEINTNTFQNNEVIKNVLSLTQQNWIPVIILMQFNNMIFKHSPKYFEFKHIFLNNSGVKLEVKKNLKILLNR